MKTFLTLFLFSFLFSCTLYSQEKKHSTLYTMEDEHIFRSLDGEVTWEQLPQQPDDITMIAWTKLKPEGIFAATENGILVLWNDGENNWRVVFQGEKGSLIEKIGFTMNEHILWCLLTNIETAQQQYFVSIDGGMTWAQTNRGNQELNTDTENTVTVYADKDSNRKGDDAK